MAVAATEANDRRMRPGNNNNNRRGRNRGPRKPHSGMPSKNQNFDGGGSDTRVRGNVYQVLEKYLQLARDAGVAGDRVAAENFLQHADHYYRVITTMNDGQRPRVGGREISVADVNVQNVSQGLSAALYSGGPSQPNMSDPGSSGPAPQQGSGGQNSSHQGNGQGNNSEDNQQSRDGNVRAGHGGDSHGGEGDGGGDYGQQNQNRDRNNRGRSNNPNRHSGSYGNSGGNQSVQGNNGAAPPVVDRAPIPNPVAPVQTSDEQPEYPEHLLPPAASEAAGDGTRAPRDGTRPPRGRLRTRRPRAAEGEGETVAETTAPVTEGSE
jgi:hypothetical protein